MDEQKTAQPATEKKLTQKWWFWVLLFLLFGFILTIGSCGACIWWASNEAENQAGNINAALEDLDFNTNVDLGDVSDADDAMVYAVGDEVMVKDLVWTVTKVEDMGDTLLGADSEYPSIQDDVPASEGSTFVKVYYEIGNDGKESVSVTSPDLVDAEGRSFSESDESYAWLNDEEDAIFETLNPGTSGSYAEIYEVPVEALSGMSFEANGLDYLSTNTALINLGL